MLILQFAGGVLMSGLAMLVAVDAWLRGRGR